jgi:uncharacterized protein
VDVKPAPSLAVRIAASFNVPVFVPARPWREEQKSELLKHLKVSVQNAHERDALSAAVMAFRANQNTLGQSIPANDLLPEQKELLRHLILQGIRQTAAIEMVKGKKEEEKEPEKPEAKKPAQPTAAKSEMALILRLEREIAELKKRIFFLENENASLQRRLEGANSSSRHSVMKDRAIQKLAYEAARLRTELNQMRQKHPKKPSINPPSGKNSIEKYRLVPASGDALKALDERDARLERMIWEYRKGRAGK